DGIRDFHVTGVQTCALPIFAQRDLGLLDRARAPQADQDDLLQAQLPVLDLGDVLELGGQARDAPQRRALLEVELVAVERRVLGRSEERRVGKEGGAGGCAWS